MGCSLTSNHVYNSEKLTKAQFKKKFTDGMKAKGYTTAKEDDGELCYALFFSADRRWVTVLTEESTDTRKEAAKLAKSLDLHVLSAELVDSDFAKLTLFDKSGAVDTMFLGEPYFDEVPEPNPLKWQTLLGIDWSKVEEIQQGDHTFAEDALSEFGEVIGCENMLLEYGDAGDDAEWLYFEKAGEKKLTLNSAFKQVFGPELEKLDFKLAKGTKKPIYYRIVSDELIHLLSVADVTGQSTAKRDEKAFDIIGDVICLYNKLDKDDPLYCDENNYDIYRQLIYRKKDSTVDFEYMRKIYGFIYLKNNNESLISLMNYALSVSKKELLSELSKVYDLKSHIRYCTIFHGYLVNIEAAFNEFGVFESGLKESGDSSLMLIKANDHDDGMWNLLEASECISKRMKMNRPGFNPVRYQKEYDKLNNYRIEKNDLRDKIFNTPELYNKAIELADKIKAENIEVLKLYGIEI